MTRTFSYDIDEMFAEIEKFNRLQREYEEQTLAEIIIKYDFMVGSKELKGMLETILPEGANIVYSPYIEDPTSVYAIKKFDMMDLLCKPQEKNREWINFADDLMPIIDEEESEK